jgi:hypothetical protein
LPPSAKLIIKVQQKEIINKTYLPARTVRYALSRLRNENILQERFCFQDARQSLYGLNAQTLEVITA